MSVALAWNASPDGSVIGYRIHWGVKSGTYTNSFAFGSALTGTISNLVRGVTYYFAATAYDARGVQSPFSNESIWNSGTVPPVTNYVGVVVTTRSNLTAPAKVLWQTVRTNPPGAAEFFETSIWTTNSGPVVTRLNTSTLSITNITSK